MKIQNFLNKIEEIRTWIFLNPKKFYKYSLIIITLCFTGSILKFIFFPPPKTTSINVPFVFSKSDEIIKKKKEKIKEKEDKMAQIVNELQHLKLKREKFNLTREDSLRIEYLYNQYQKISHGN